MPRVSGSSVLGVALAALAACAEPDEPPGPRVEPRVAHLVAPPVAPAEAGSVIPASARDSGGELPDDGGAQPAAELAAIAAETSIYEEPRWSSRRLGYLRAGAVVRRGLEPVAAGPRCPGGWYRIEPRGHVCVGAMATLDLRHPVAVAAAHPPGAEGLPYRYALSRSPTPPLYARLPSRADQLRFEPDLREHLARNVSPGSLPPPDTIPAFLSPGSPSLSLGNDWHSPDRVLLGRARPRSGFALLGTFDHQGRRFAVTPGLEVIPLDRTRLVEQSRFSGVVLGDAVTLPVAFARRPVVFRAGAADPPKAGGALPTVAGRGAAGPAAGAPLGFREATAVTDETRSVGGVRHVVARDGALLREDQLVIVKPFRHPPAWALAGVKWIDVSIPRQTLTAYEGRRPVYVTLVSTGVGGTGDPEETHATVQGAFRIYEKHVTVTMGGSEASDPFDLRDVPYVQYFTGGFALHAAYWHDDFGHAHSHGCVNLSPIDAAWLFRWTDPRVPPGWHGTMSAAGTIVYVHG